MKVARRSGGGQFLCVFLYLLLTISQHGIVEGFLKDGFSLPCLRKPILINREVAGVPQSGFDYEGYAACWIPGKASRRSLIYAAVEKKEKEKEKEDQQRDHVANLEDQSIPFDVVNSLFSGGQENNATVVAAATAAASSSPWASWLLDDNGNLHKSRFTNLILLIAGASYGLSLILTVDMDIWRGWDLGEIIVRIPYDNWQEYEGGLTTHPILVKTVINVVIYLVGDWMAQVGWGRSRPLLDFDLARTARNGLIGALFGPLVHYYYDFSDWILPMDVPVNRVLKIIMDQTIYFITKCSLYIALVGLLRGDNGEQIVKDVREKIVPIVVQGWKFWPLAHIVTYGFIPPRHRVLWVNSLDIIWSYLIASITSNPIPPSPPPPSWDSTAGDSFQSAKAIASPPISSNGEKKKEEIIIK